MTVAYLRRGEVYAYPTKHDPDEKVFYSVGWRPQDRLPTYEYLLDELIFPEAPNGFFYVCLKPGVSGSTPPVWPTEVNATVMDGTVKWQAVPYNLMLRSGDTMSSTWEASDGVTIDNLGGNGAINWARVTAVPTGVRKFKLTNRVTVTRLDGKVEDFDMTLAIKVL